MTHILTKNASWGNEKMLHEGMKNCLLREWKIASWWNEKLLREGMKNCFMREWKIASCGNEKMLHEGMKNCLMDSWNIYGQAKYIFKVYKNQYSKICWTIQWQMQLFSLKKF